MKTKMYKKKSIEYIVLHNNYCTTTVAEYNKKKNVQMDGTVGHHFTTT
jgi:hypothetical protein